MRVVALSSGRHAGFMEGGGEGACRFPRGPATSNPGDWGIPASGGWVEPDLGGGREQKPALPL